MKLILGMFDKENLYTPVYQTTISNAVWENSYHMDQPVVRDLRMKTVSDQLRCFILVFIHLNSMHQGNWLARPSLVIM